MDPIHLRAAGTSLLVAFPEGEAEIVHWGADLGDALPDLRLLGAPVPHSAFDAPVVAGLIPQASSGWLGRPGLRGHRVVDGRGFSAALRVVSAERVDGAPDGADRAVDVAPDIGNSAVSREVRSDPAESYELGATLRTSRGRDGHADGGRGIRIVQADPDAGLEVTTVFTLHEGGLLEVTHELCNTGESDYALDELSAALPVPGEAAELLDLTGRWCRENHPQRQSIRQGTWVRTGRHGRTGHDSSLLVAAGTAGFANRSGRVWATHLGWSGDHEQYLDATADGRRMLGAAELLGSGEVVLAPGETYRTPTLYAAYSDRGLDGVTDAFYRWFRARPGHVDTVSGRVRPVVLNTWEAVYFDHRIEPLIELADAAAALGVERFVLDDGWFRGRRNDHAGLGDWYVDETVWPEGLTPLIDAVTSHGMEFGLWVEPEMINLDSDIARAHPDWVSGPSGRMPREWRHQHVIDLVNPEAWQYVYDRLDALLRGNDIAYLKWDQNRDLTEAGHAGRPSMHAQTLAVYRLLDALRATHPDVEIESCSSGGARVDLGILARTDRVWASDCNDALERQTIQRWTEAVLPPELVGAHVGPTHSHTTGRVHDIGFRAITALFGHFGIEWDIRQATPHERDVLAQAIALYKEHRALLHSGVRVNADIVEPNLVLHGVVAQDGGEALFAAVALGTLAAETPGRVGLPGLDPDRVYRVEGLLPAARVAGEAGSDGDAQAPGGETEGREAADVHAPIAGEVAHPVGEERDAFVQIAPPAWWRAGGLTASGRFLAEVGMPLPVLRPEHALLLRAVAV